MPNYGYHLARAQGGFTRAAYRALLPLIVRRQVKPPREIPLQVFAYSGETSLPEQVASIRSFLKNVGRPKRFTVVSDGTYSEKSVSLLQHIHPVVSVMEVPVPPPNFPSRLTSYLTTHPTGKQLALVMSLPREEPAIYIDSDVRFFPGADDILEVVKSCPVPALYLQDCGFAGDERLLHGSEEKSQPVNTGVLFLFRSLDWSLSADRFGELEGEPTFFTNQTMAHLAMHANEARPLDPAKYVLQLDDQFIYPDRYAGPGLALRHYVNPVRHKFWTSLKW